MTGALQGNSLAARLMVAQVLVIVAGAGTLLVTAFIVAPGLFRDHLAHSGVTEPVVIAHAEEAFAVSVGIALPVGAAAALVAAGLVSWFLVRRITRPIEQLAAAADAIAVGQSDIEVPEGGYSVEIQQLSASFAAMAQRLAEVDASRARMLADLAHEIRTPLATLEVYLEGMEDGVVPQTPQSWTTARLQVDRLRRLSRDVREVANAQEHALDLHPQVVRASDAAAAAVALIRPRAQASGVDAVLAGADDQVFVMADPDRLGQVLGNLLDNAVRHTPAGGRVEVTVSSSDDQVVLAVSDTGPGIAASEREAVFERFHRSDPARAADGAAGGLGLTIARAIIADHGGRIEAAAPASGTGACLRVTLPRVAAPTPTA